MKALKLNNCLIRRSLLYQIIWYRGLFLIGGKKEMAGRRGNGEGSIVKRSDGRWCAAYIDIETNKRKYVYGKSQKEVREKMKLNIEASKLEKEKNATVDVVDDSVENQTLEEVILYYLHNFKKVELKPSTFNNYIDVFNYYIKGEEMARKMIQEVTTNDLQKYYNSKVAEGYSSKTIRHMAVVINGALEYAERTGIIAVNPNRHTILPKKKKYEAKVLTEEEVLRIIELGVEEDIYPLVVLCVTCGLRRGEALALRWENVQFQEHRIRIVGNLCRVGQEDDENGKRHSVYEVLEPKTKSSIRTVYLPEIAYQALLLQKQRQERDKEEYAEIYLDNGFVFARPDGRHLNPRQMLEHFHKFLVKYGITDIRFHDLRHTAATMMLEADISIKIVQDILGHSNLATTADIYSHISENKKEQAIRQLELAYRNKSVSEQRYIVSDATEMNESQEK